MKKKQITSRNLKITGFTLIEICTSVLIFTISLSFLYGVQTATIKITTERQKLNIALSFIKERIHICESNFRKNKFSCILWKQQKSFRIKRNLIFNWTCKAYPFILPEINYNVPIKYKDNNLKKIIEQSIYFNNLFIKKTTSILSTSIIEINTGIEWGRKNKKKSITAIQLITSKAAIKIIQKRLTISYKKCCGIITSDHIKIK